MPMAHSTNVLTVMGACVAQLRLSDQLERLRKREEQSEQDEQDEEEGKVTGWGGSKGKPAAEKAGKAGRCVIPSSLTMHMNGRVKPYSKYHVGHSQSLVMTMPYDWHSTAPYTL